MIKCGSCDSRINVGELKHKIRLESPVVNASGEQTGDWVRESDAWAKIKPLFGRELYLAMQVSPRVTHEITTRYMPGVQPDWRIVFGERVFNIERVINPMEDNVTLEFMGVESPQELV